MTEPSTRRLPRGLVEQYEKLKARLAALDKEYAELKARVEKAEREAAERDGA